MARISDRKTGTYYVQYKLLTKRKVLGKNRYSKNFKLKSQVIKFVKKIRKLGGSYHVYFSESIIHDRVVNI